MKKNTTVVLNTDMKIENIEIHTVTFGLKIVTCVKWKESSNIFTQVLHDRCY
jgi:hypothetical protein